jgi:molybdate transport system regulatory protein
MEMKMSYRKAWATIRASEKRLGFPLLDRKVGGHAGGGSQITAEGRRFMKQYGLFRKDVELALETTYRKHFGP